MVSLMDGVLAVMAGRLGSARSVSWNAYMAPCSGGGGGERERDRRKKPRQKLQRFLCFSLGGPRTSLILHTIWSAKSRKPAQIQEVGNWTPFINEKVANNVQLIFLYHD